MTKVILYHLQRCHANSSATRLGLIFILEPRKQFYLLEKLKYYHTVYTGLLAASAGKP